MNLSQGNTYRLGLKLFVEGAEILADNVDVVEVMIGDIRKTYGEDGSEITYDSETNEFIIPLSQEETFGLDVYHVPIQIRVLENGEVVCTKVELHDVSCSLSKEILEVDNEQ